MYSSGVGSRPTFACIPSSRLKDELGVNGIAAELNPGGLLSPDQEMRSLQILMREVMPAFLRREAVPGALA